MKLCKEKAFLLGRLEGSCCDLSDTLTFTEGKGGKENAVRRRVSTTGGSRVGEADR